ncbi:MAG TPA: ferrochelatase [Pirellulales bacterium]|nr:ferrochelatase [Pirellulales bacterium]
MSTREAPAYDSLLVVSFGGPEAPEHVLPFLENVLRGRNVPRARMLEVAEHYYRLGGVSPLNGQVRAMIAALEKLLAEQGPRLPIYWGNRNWHPMLADTIAQMAADGRKHALAFVNSGYSSYSSCRQYRENIAAALESVGPAAPRIDKLRAFYNHPRFIEATVDRVREAIQRVPEPRRSNLRLVFTAHSIPTAMAANCRYAAQLEETCRLISAAWPNYAWRLVYQSRSGPPAQPWLGPDVNEHLAELAAAGMRDVVIAPIGFVSDHMEVLYDLDTEAKATCERLGIDMQRAATVGTHPAFIAMIRDLILERMNPALPHCAVGNDGPSHDFCPVNCCLPAQAAAPAP